METILDIINSTRDRLILGAEKARDLINEFITPQPSLELWLSAQGRIKIAKEDEYIERNRS